MADVIIDVANAAADHDLGVLLAIDEAQMVDADDLRRLLAGVHRCGQDSLPMACVLAGLPNLVGFVAKAATYAERMFTVSELGALAPGQVARAIVEPASELAVERSVEAIEAITDHSDGFPFFVQTWAYHTWNAAYDEPISAADVELAAPHASERSARMTARTARSKRTEAAADEHSCDSETSARSAG